MYFRIYPIASKWRWEIRSGNNRVLARSYRHYDSMGACMASIDVVREEADGAEIRTPMGVMEE